MHKLTSILVLLCFIYSSQAKKINSKVKPPVLFEELSTLDINSSIDTKSPFYAATEDVKSIIFNPESFKYVEGDDGLYYALNSGLVTGQKVIINSSMFEFPLTLSVQSVHKYFNDIELITYSGIVKGDSNSEFTLSVEENIINGRIKYGNYIYYISPNENFAGLLTISKINESKVPKDSNDFRVSKDALEKESKNLETNIRSSGADGILSIYFYYGNGVTGVSSLVSNFITDVNKVLENSIVSFNNRAISVGTHYINNDFDSDCKSGYLDDMKDSRSPFTNLDTEIANNYADIGVLIADADNSLNCFAGYTGHVGGEAIIWDSSDPYFFIADSYMGTGTDYTGVHELGHVLKGYHPGDPDVTVYNQGLIDTSDSSNYWQSMMGSYHQDSSEGPCLFTGPNPTTCDRIKYFTNPALTYNSDPLGSSTEDMESHLESYIPTASDWRGGATAKASSPTTFYASNPECYGFYTLDWDSMTNAVEYHLFKSTNSNFSNPTLIYSGASNSAGVNVTSGTWYFRVKSINTAGASAYSSQISATRVTYCQ